MDICPFAFMHAGSAKHYKEKTEEAHNGKRCSLVKVLFKEMTFEQKPQ